MYRLYMCQLPTLTSFTCITQHPAFPVCMHLKPVFVFNVISTLYIVWRTRELKNEFQKLLAATNRAVSLCAYISTLLCQLQLIFRCYPCCLGHVWNKGCSQQPAPTVGAMENPCPPPHGLGPLCPFLL